MILQAANTFGIPAERTGRNDITVEGKKFSGNAFYQSEDFYYHHGTLLVDVNKEMMSKYLNASVKKLQSKGVDSVRSRVCNLNEYNTMVTIASLKEALLESFGKVYGGIPVLLDESRLAQDKIIQIKERLESWEWIFGREIAFNAQWEHRFSWGEIQIQMSVQKGIIEEILVWTDAMEVELSKSLEGYSLVERGNERGFCKS